MQSHEPDDRFRHFIYFKMDFFLQLLISSYIITATAVFVSDKHFKDTFHYRNLFRVTLFDVTRQTFNVCPNNERQAERKRSKKKQHPPQRNVE